MTIRAYWRKEPWDDKIQVEKPIIHKQALELLFNEKIKVPGEFIEETGCYPEELEKYCFLETGTLTSKPTNLDNVISLKPKFER